MSQDHERQLLDRARAGDFQAFEDLVSRHEGRLYALALHVTRDHHDAQDVVQNALLSAMEHLDQFRGGRGADVSGGEASFGAWVGRIAVNQALKLIRGRKVRRAVSLDGTDGDGADIPAPRFIASWREDPALAMDRKELRQVLDAGVDELPEGQRLVFVLRDMQGLSVAETAAALDITETNVKVRLLRARLALREYLTQRFGDESKRLTPVHDHDHSSLFGRVVAAATGRTPAQKGGQP